MTRRSPIVAALCLAVLSLAPAPLVAADPPRPRDPWVFRSVLDKRPRMLTVALHEKLWVTYDTQDCTLRRAWAGGVRFSGGVYDSAHGPQPTSLGEPLFKAPEAGGAWAVAIDGKPVAALPRYRGYRLGDNDVRLLYDLELPQGRVRVEESPECRVEGDRVTLVRTIKLTGLPAGAVASLGLVGEPASAVEHAVDVSGTTALHRPSTTAPATQMRLTADGTIQLSSTWTHR